MTITLSGIQFRALSPSHFVQVGYPVAIAFDGVAWLVSVRGAWGIREFASREEAAQVVVDGFNFARENLG